MPAISIEMLREELAQVLSINQALYVACKCHQAARDLAGSRAARLLQPHGWRVGEDMTEFANRLIDDAVAREEFERR